MIDPVHDRRPPITPQLALRVAVLGGLAFVLFAIIFFRLWYLQVLSGDQYLQQANNNKVRVTRIPAPRGAIVDRNGQVLVENRVATIVQMDPESLPVAEREQAATWGQRVTSRSRRPKGKQGPKIPMPPPATPELRGRFARLAGVLGMSARTIQDRVVQSLVLASYANITVKVDVPQTVRNYLLERSELFPGIHVEKTYLRSYPRHSLAAQLVGTVGEISPQELKLKRFRGVPAGTIVGKEGIERTYDRYLRGVDGATRITVDALGRPKGQGVARAPVPGRQVKLSLDLGLQEAGQQALSKVINSGPGTAGAFVAMDPNDGKVLAMGSYPSYDPAVLSRPITKAKYNRLFGATAGAPRFNRAMQGLYPTGSIFKPITAMAALSNGVITPDTPINDPGCIKIGAAGQQFCNAKSQVNGTVSLRRAIQVSSDVFFYTLGRDLNNNVPGLPLQSWAHKLGLGARTGIDLPDEFKGTVPDPKWRDSRNRLEAQCRKRNKIPLTAPPSAGCGIADGTNRPWTVGDNVNLSVGQGDLQATPLQMATVYATLANGGHVVRPHLGMDVEDANGRLVQKIDSGAPRRVKLDPGYLNAITDGLHMATTGDGTSADVFAGWNQSAFPVYGKTGTAERRPKNDQSWYVCYVPNQRKPIVLAVTVEEGGFGAVGAAPVARYMLGEWFDQKKVFKAGKSQTN
jgi:penicillin-binding protein 2